MKDYDTYNGIKWNKTCPYCGLPMAENNKFCCLQCYKEFVKLYGEKLP
jgi:predicted nucleic acid-binding Zn ribbon protein